MSVSGPGSAATKKDRFARLKATIVASMSGCAWVALAALALGTMVHADEPTYEQAYLSSKADVLGRCSGIYGVVAELYEEQGRFLVARGARKQAEALATAAAGYLKSLHAIVDATTPDAADLDSEVARLAAAGRDAARAQVRAALGEDNQAALTELASTCHF